MKKGSYITIILILSYLILMFINKENFFIGKAVNNPDGESTLSSCTSNWQCSLWNSCINGQQTRTCNDLNNCQSSSLVLANVVIDPNVKPPTTRVCNCNPLLCNPSNQNQYCYDYQWANCPQNKICSGGNCISIIYALTASKSGTGSGSITSNINGINCGNDCNENYNSGTQVTLTATSNTGSVFNGWNGACTGTENCNLVIDGNKQVTASFSTVPTCVNECSTSGSKQCSGNGYQTCGNYDVDSCLEWSTVTNCVQGQTCSNGVCTASCTDECSQGSKQCSGNGYQTCGNYDADSCLEWSNIIICDGQTCSNGNCISQQTTLKSIIKEDKLKEKKSVTQTSNIDLSNCPNGNNKCSNKPGYLCDNKGSLFEDSIKCPCPNNGKFLDGSCVQVVKGIESNDLSIFDKSSNFLFIPKIKIDENSNLESLIELNNYIIYYQDIKINFNFKDNKKEFKSEIIDCFIKNNIFGCNKPKKDGNLEIEIFADNGRKESSSIIYLEIIPKSFGFAKGVLGGKGSENKAPVANAGEDKIAIIGASVILDGSKSYDEDNNIPNLPDNYVWYEHGKEIGKGINLKKSFSSGNHKIILQVIDSGGLSSTDSVNVLIKSRDKCRDTNTLYFPQDTNCNKKWPSQEGELLNLNSPGYSCNLVEVCNEDIDPIVQESIDCCDGTPLTKDQNRINACDFANRNSNQNTKKCQALYVIESLGGSRIYMKDYLEVEMCCKGVEQLCNNEKNLYSARPLPKTNKDLSDLRCKNDPNNNPPGEWVSDSKLELNNIALQDVPTHVSLNLLSSGTCVDYSFSITTLLRKLGYKQDEIYTVEASNHAYNLVKLPLDKKYTIVDTTGNNNPAILLGKVIQGYKYCEGIQKCYNDNGQALCPTLEEIYGCENIEQNIAQKSKVIGFKTNKFFDNLINLIKNEVLR